MEFSLKSGTGMDQAARVLARRLWVFAIAAALVLPLSLSAQSPVAPAADFDAPEKAHPATPVDFLREFDAQPETDYRLAEGDEITVNVWGRPELSGKHTVGPDGKITLPYAGELKVADLTRGEAEQAALKQWQEAYEALKVTVSVEHYEGNRIFILGRVSQPGVLHFEKQPTLLEAISRAGALPVVGNPAETPALTRCVIFRGNDKVAWVDLHALLNGGNLAMNIHLRRDDTLFIPDGDDQLVYVMGEVLRPGAIRMTRGMSFMDAIAQAGGPTKDAGGTIHLLRHSANLERDIRMNQIVKNGTNPNVALESGDLLYVPRSGMAKVGYVMEQLSPATTYLLFASGVKNF